MRSEPFWHRADDGVELHVHRWLPADTVPRKAVVHIAHGMAEHGGRYARAAEALTEAGYVVYADDHRGHGKTAKTDDDLGFFAAERGFDRAVRDLEELLALELRDNPGLGVVLFGHSMGSFMTQRFVIEHGEALAGAVLSGSGGKPGLLASAGRLVARVERMRVGARGKSNLLDGMSFGRFNKDFAPTRTDFDWLSRDPAEVDAYVADPRCGFACTTQLWVDLLDALDAISRPEEQARIPKELPIYVFSGAEDPVGEHGKSVERLLAAYRRAGLRRVTSRIYPGARHEMLNETNRDEVVRDLIGWLDASVVGSSRAEHAVEVK
jgi:alpha-beta hydrolase superfamily lysophospholipase